MGNYWPERRVNLACRSYFVTGASSNNSHITWQRSISICTCAPSPKCLDERAHRVRSWRHHNLKLRNPGEKIKNSFSSTYWTQKSTRIHQFLHKFSENCSFEISLSQNGVVNSTVAKLMPKFLLYFFGISRSLRRSLRSPSLILWLEESVLGK